MYKIIANKRFMKPCDKETMKRKRNTKTCCTTLLHKTKEEQKIVKGLKTTLRNVTNATGRKDTQNI